MIEKNKYLYNSLKYTRSYYYYNFNTNILKPFTRDISVSKADTRQTFINHRPVIRTYDIQSEIPFELADLLFAMNSITYSLNTLYNCKQQI